MLLGTLFAYSKLIKGGHLSFIFWAIAFGICGSTRYCLQLMCCLFQRNFFFLNLWVPLFFIFIFLPLHLVGKKWEEKFAPISAVFLSNTRKLIRMQIEFFHSDFWFHQKFKLNFSSQTSPKVTRLRVLRVFIRCSQDMREKDTQEEKQRDEFMSLFFTLLRRALA